MRVPSETAERRGRLKRPLVSVVAVAAFALLGYLYLPPSAPNVAAPSAGDCAELHLWSNGYHSDIGAPAALFPENHPLRRLYPQAHEFLIGWGDERFYYSDGTNLWLGLDALVPPSASVMHVAYDAPQAAVYLGPNDDVAVAISGEGAARFVAYIDQALVLDVAGAPIITAPGKFTGRSSFLRTRGSFHLFNVCNQWMARALRAAGVKLNARAAWLAGPLIAQVRRAAQTKMCNSQ